MMSFPSHLAHKAAMVSARFCGPQPGISRSCQTIRTHNQCVARCACLLHSLRWRHIILLSGRDNVCEQLAQGRIRQCSGCD